jgi:hypothetical protein
VGRRRQHRLQECESVGSNKQELSNTRRRRSVAVERKKPALRLRNGAMPITELFYPVLSRFLCAVEMTTGLPAQPLDAPPEQRQRVEEDEKKVLPKGVVLGPDGKPYVHSYPCTAHSNR